MSFETRLGTPACGGAARRLTPLRGVIYAAARRPGGACGALKVRCAHPYQHRKVAIFPRMFERITFDMVYEIQSFHMILRQFPYFRVWDLLTAANRGSGGCA